MNQEKILNTFERYLHNTATSDEVSALLNWIKNNPNLTSWLEQQISNSASDIDKDLQIKMLSQIKAKIAASEKIKSESSYTFIEKAKLQKYIRIAAMFILPLITAALVFIYMSNADTPKELIVSADRGQKASILLPDGSKAWINSLTKLTYTTDFNKHKRILELSGEAYFEVAHNPKKPFIVKTKDMAVEALGTSFGVKAYDEDLYAAGILMTGKVKVTTDNEITILKPDERIVYNKLTKKTSKTKINAKYFTGWIHNELRFENEPLSEIAKSIERIYNIDIQFGTEKLKKLRYTGTVENNSLESLLNIIALTSPISFEISDQQITILENKSMMKHYK